MDLKQDSTTSHTLQKQTSTLKMEVFWDAKQKEGSLREIPPPFLDYHRVSVEIYEGIFFHHVLPLARC